MKEKNVNQLACFDNSLKEITSNLSKFHKRTQQYISLYAAFFINNFHSTHEHNKAEHNKTPPIALKTPPIVRVLLH